MKPAWVASLLVVVVATSGLVGYWVLIHLSARTHSHLPASYNTPATPRPASTDGRFASPPASRRIALESPQSSYQPCLGLSVPSPNPNLELADSTPARIFRGRLVDADSGRAIPNGHVRLATVPSFGQAFLSTTGASDGFFELPAGNTTHLIAAADGYAQVAFALATASDSEHEIALPRSASLEAVVLVQGHPLMGAIVQLTSCATLVQTDLSKWTVSPDAQKTWVAPADHGGSALFEGLPPYVPLELSVLLNERVLREPEPVVLQRGEKRRLPVSFDRGGTVHGRVVGEEGLALANIDIVIVPYRARPINVIEAFDEPVVITQTDPYGCFVFRDVGWGQWLVGTQKPSIDRKRPLVDAADSLIGLAERIHLTPSALFAEVEIRVERAAYLRGIVFSDDVPASACQVRARALDSDYPIGGETDGGGAFSLGPLFAGYYQIEAGGNGSEFTLSEPIVVAAGAPIELSVSSGQSLRLRAVDVAGNLKPCRFLILDTVDEYEVIHASVDGTFECRGLLAGVYAITALTADGQWGRKFCNAGSTANNDIAVQPGARLLLTYNGDDVTTMVRVFVEDQVFWSDMQDRDCTTTIIVPPGPVEVRWGWGEGEDEVQRIKTDMSKPSILLWPRNK